MCKAALIRSIVATGYTAKSPHTLRRYPLDMLQGMYESQLQLMVDNMPVTLVSIDLPMPADPIEPDDDDDEPDTIILPEPELPRPAPAAKYEPIYPGFASRWLALALRPWTLARGIVLGV